MAKYSFEFKLKIVREYFDGKGGTCYLTKKYKIKPKTQVINWINAYREFGEDGLFRKRQNQRYSVQFKMDAIELYQTSELSYREVANHLGINNPSLIANWMKSFRLEGMDGLSKKKGRSSIMSKEEEEKETPGEYERMKELEKQVRSLQIENVFLKELRKLRKREAQQRRMSQSHESSTASEDRLN